jgi:hypothetical protein
VNGLKDLFSKPPFHCVLSALQICNALDDLKEFQCIWGDELNESSVGRSVCVLSDVPFHRVHRHHDSISKHQHCPHQNIPNP